MSHPYFARTDRAPFLNPAIVLAQLQSERRPLYAGILPIAEWRSTWSVLTADRADFLGVLIGNEKPVEVIVICAATRPPMRDLDRIDAMRALELAQKWLRHRRRSEVETSDAWRVEMFPQLEDAARA